MNKFKSKDVLCFYIDRVWNNTNNLSLTENIYNAILSDPSYQGQSFISLKDIIKIIKRETNSKSAFLYGIGSDVQPSKGTWIRVMSKGNPTNNEYLITLRFQRVTVKISRKK